MVNHHTVHRPHDAPLIRKTTICCTQATTRRTYYISGEPPYGASPTAGADPGFFLGEGAPQGNDVADG